jgi:hypothetical protein
MVVMTVSLQCRTGVPNLSSIFLDFNGMFGSVPVELSTRSNRIADPERNPDRVSIIRNYTTHH